MSEFYTLSDEQKEACHHALVDAALPLWGLQGAKVELIKQRENAVFSISSNSGFKAVMRIHRAGYHTDTELLSELQWMEALNDFGVRTPAIIPTQKGELFKTVSVPQIPEPRQIDLLAWIDGAPVGTIEDGFNDLEQACQNYKRIGGLIAKMHIFSGQWTEPQQFTRHSWDSDGLLGESPWWGRFWELDLLNDAQREKLQLARVKAAGELAQYGREPDRYGLIHADPLPENFLVGNDGIVRVIDFDDGGYGWFMFDFATALFFSLGEDHFDDLLEAMVSGYQEQRALPPGFYKMLPVFMLLRGLTYLGWAHTRRETDTAKELGPIFTAATMGLVADYLA